MKKQALFKKHWFVLVCVIALSLVVLAACNLPGSDPSTGDPIEQAKQTLVAQQTQDYFQTVVAQLTQVAPTDVPVQSDTDPSITPADKEPTEIPATAIPATAVPPTAVPATQVPTAIPATAVPTQIPPTPTPVPCYQVGFVADVSVPDGSKIPGGDTFVKTWRLKNTGSCTWDTRFDIAFVKGTQLAVAKLYDLKTNVRPGETVDISIEMIAPANNGEYKSEWMLVNDRGEKFGTGPKSDGTFWAKIQVVDGKGAIFNFASKACDAKWSSDTKGTLPCPGDKNKVSDGYVSHEKEPIREDGGKENEPGLITRPSKNLSGGYIQGIYPGINIRNGDQFKAVIQCQGGATKCNLKFELYYTVGNEKAVELGEWHEVFDNKWNPITIDLSSLAGKNVVFTLVVWNKDSAEDNIGLWLDPVIFRP